MEMGLFIGDDDGDGLELCIEDDSGEGVALCI